jgi:hypothetical protein
MIGRRSGSMSVTRILVALAWCLGAAGSAAAQEGPQSAAAPEGPQYVGADSCKTCHQAIYDVWVNTKHARALNRLSSADKKTDCIRCHVTGTAEQIAAEGDAPKFPGAQCESCHGAASLHVADPTVTKGLAKKPSESVCTKCHNEKSPHYRGFVYAAMVGLSHPVKK